MFTNIWPSSIGITCYRSIRSIIRHLCRIRTKFRPTQFYFFSHFYMGSMHVIECLHWTRSCASSPDNSLSDKSFLMLSNHLRFGLPLSDTMGVMRGTLQVWWTDYTSLMVDGRCDQAVDVATMFTCTLFPPHRICIACESFSLLMTMLISFYLLWIMSWLSRR